MGHFSDIDYYKMSEDLDFVSWDNYPNNQWGAPEYQSISMAHELMRGVKNKNFVVMEHQSGAAGWDIVGSTPRPGQLRLWTYQSIAHGAEGIVYFRFRTALFGVEQYWYGVLDHDGIPRRRYYELQETAAELYKLEPYINNIEKKYDALLVKSYNNVWSHQIKRHAAGYDYNTHLYSFYKANADLNINCAVSNGNYDNYKIVYMPAYNIVNDDEIVEIRRYVENGGTLVLTFKSGTRDMFNNIRPINASGIFADIAGIEVEESDAPRKSVQVCGEVEGNANIWCDIIKPVTANVVCCYDSEYYKGKAAVTVNDFGKGKVYYVGCDLDDAAMEKLVLMIAKNAGVETISTPSGVEIIKREGYKIVLNHTENKVNVPLTGRSLISNTEFSGSLDGFGVEFIVG